ncbi:MAG: hypothetical protein SV186_00495 [Candidatus Nanohaloarchaea archaeon]|nr:hypothetical protein [Candidatus Nanohaloarchaea archaeon]
MVEIETFDGDGGEYSLTPYVRIHDDDGVRAEISRMEDEGPQLAYQWQNQVTGEDAYRRGMQLIKQFGLGPVEEVSIGRVTGEDSISVEGERDHLYETIRERLEKDEDQAQAIVIEAEHGSYENDWSNGYENLEAPHSDDILDFALDQADIDDAYDTVLSGIDETLL